MTVIWKFPAESVDLHSDNMFKQQCGFLSMNHNECIHSNATWAPI